MSAVLLACQGLTRRFGDFTAVSDVNFRIERGEIFGFLGSNGCGKTTTMKMLTGLLDITEGQARLLGKPVPHAERVFGKFHNLGCHKFCGHNVAK